MVSLHPGIALREICRKDKEKHSAKIAAAGNRTHLERIVQALKSDERLENLSVDYQGQKKSLQEYILDDVIKSKERGAILFAIMPLISWDDINVSRRMESYFWGYQELNIFSSAYMAADLLSNDDWVKGRRRTQYDAGELSRSLGKLLAAPIYARQNKARDLQGVRAVIDYTLPYMQTLAKSIPEIRLCDFLPSGRKKRHDKNQLELLLEANAYGLVHRGQIAKDLISSIGHSVRKEYLRAHPE
jgi:hypothetical protein